MPQILEVKYFRCLLKMLDQYGDMSDDNWHKLPHPHMYYAIEGYPLREATHKGTSGIIMGFECFGHREVFVSKPCIMVSKLFHEVGGRFTNVDYYKTRFLTNDIYDKHYKYKKAFEKSHKVVNDKGYCAKYGLAYSSPVQEAPAPLVVKATKK